MFPLDLLPVVSLGSTLFHFAIGLAIWLVFHLFLQGLPPVTALWMPLIVLPLALFALGLGWWLASLGVFGAAIATTIEPGRTFYPAESYHQDYLTLHPNERYIVYNDLPKIDNLKRLFPAAYRDQPVTVAAIQ